MCFLWAHVCGCREKPWEAWETGESVGIVETGAQRSKRDTPHKLGGLETMKVSESHGGLRPDLG